ncbi:MAG: prepilin-type N-terminal cleavage/methylation domain-containing protein, partial [Myxococcota bacterium]
MLKSKKAARGYGSERGFTLIEVMLALGVLLLGILLGILPMQIIAVTNNTVAFQKSTAGLLARDFVDNFHSFTMSRLLNPD